MKKHTFLRCYFSLFFLLLGDESEMEFDYLKVGVLFFFIILFELDDLNDFLLNNSTILYNLCFGRVF